LFLGDFFEKNIQCKNVFYQQKFIACTKLKKLIKEKHWYEHIKKQNIFETNKKLVKLFCHKNKMDRWVIEIFLFSFPHLIQNRIEQKKLGYY